MRVLVSGSTGLVGKALVERLREVGEEARGLVRRPRGPREIGWDPARGELPAAQLEGIEAVVHLAGEGIGDHRWTEEQKRRIRDSRVTGTTLLVGALAGLDQRPAVLVSGSAVGIYGDRGDEQCTETSPVGHGFLAEVAIAWEAAAQPAASAGIRVATVRTGIVLGADGGTLPRLARLARFGVLGKLGSGQQWMSWISLADQVRAMRFVLEGDLEGPVNLTAPVPVTNEVLTKTLGRVLHRPTFLPIPRVGPKLLLGAELAETLLYEGQRVLPDRLLEAGYEFRFTDLEPALADVLR
jgi:uncharacterized protein (TIGR01777 family)